MRRTSTVAGPKAFSNDPRSRPPERLSIQRAFDLLRRRKHPDRHDLGVAQQVIDMPMQLLDLSLVSGQARFYPVQRAARVHISTCREQERPSLPTWSAVVFGRYKIS